MRKFVLLGLFVFVQPCVGQESRGWVVGRVTDSSDAVVAGARVSAVNLATNTGATGVTNLEGNYEIPYLVPGIYRVTVELEGFAKAVREGVELRVGDRIALDFTLRPGAVAESILVTAETPLLETATSSVGMVMDEKRVQELPVIGGNAFYLTRLSAGITVTGGHSAGNPMDRGAASNSVVVNGTRTGSSEVTLDGVPNMAEDLAAFAPMQDLVQEFRIQTTSYDATLGHAAGAVVNVSMKSGTNRLHGTTYYFDSRIRAVPWFSNNFLYDPTTGPITSEKRRQANPGWLHQRWGVTLSGPLRVPRLYDGRSRTFWTFGYEGLHIDRQPTFFATVPSEAALRGDFSDLLQIGPQYRIYDPATIAPAANGRFSRQPLPENVIPASRLHPVALKMLAFYPKPNTGGTRDGRQNYFGVQKEPKDYGGYVSRVDHSFSQNHRMFGRVNFSHYLTSVQTLPTIAVGTETTQRSFGAVVDDVYVFSPSLLLNLRAGVTYYKPSVVPFSHGFDLLTLGLPQSLVNEIQSKNQVQGIAFPVTIIDGSASTPAYTQLSAEGGNSRTIYYQNYQGTLTKMAGNHSFRSGADLRIMRENGFNYGNVAPRYEFLNTWTRGPLDNAAGAPIGQGLASMLLGIPTGGRININASRAQQSVFSALFVQDDWKLMRTLTLNLGLRWEFETAMTERFNRSLRSFDFSSRSPIQQAAAANYARSPIPELPLQDFRTAGGLTFAGVAGQPRGLWTPDKNNFAPRIGIAWQLSKRTVIRTGYGIFFEPLGADQRDVNLGGFNQPTNIIPSLDNGLNFQATLSDPFPRGLDLPAGAAGGLLTSLGRDVSFFFERPRNTYMQRWSFSVQNELPGAIVLETTYVGNRGTSLLIERQLNGIPTYWLSRLPMRDQQTIDFLSTQIPNPFFGIPEFAGTSLGNSRVARSQLLRPYPHFTGVSNNETTGWSWYHSLQVNAQKRFHRGLTFQASWTWSKFMEAREFLNDADPRPAEVISDQDYPHRLTLSGIYELPIGRGRPIGSNANWFVNALIGGWQLQAWYEGQSGQALGFGNAIFTGGLRSIVLPRRERSISRWFQTEGFERNNARSLASNYRTLPLRFSWIRGDGINNCDASLFKNFQVSERARAQFRFETYNTFNHPQFANPNVTPTNTAFGTVSGEKGHGQRQLTFALKLLW